ncbi:MAG: SH3 domain-containing protein [Aggregatilineales bacterium]
MTFARLKLMGFSVPLMLLLLLGAFSVSLNTMNTVSAQDFGSGWTGVYFNTNDFTGNPVFTRVDPQINFNFGTGSPVAGFVNTDNFSVRWNGLQTLAAGTYRFTAGADDGVKVTVNGSVIIDNLATVGQFQFATADFAVPDGTSDITVEYKETTGNAAVQFYWEALSTIPTATDGPSPTPTATGLPPIPPGALTATVIRASVLRVREAPSLGGQVLGRILRGQTYQVVGRSPDAYWFLLQLSDRQAWAYGYYLFINGNEFTAPIAGASPAFEFPPGISGTGVLLQTSAGIKLRGEPNTITPQTGRIPWGSFLPVIGRLPDNSWYQVVWKGSVGWVFGGYIRVIYGDLAIVPVVNP